VRRRTFLRRISAIPATGVLIGSGAFALNRHAVDAAPAADAWEMLLSGGQVALVRHSEAPGVGEPPNFTFGDCTTQRNLNEAGRAQADRLEVAFRAQGIVVGQVLSSAWCRCIETATRAFGAAEIWMPLNAFSRDPATDAAQTAEVRARVSAWTGPGTLFLVTHQVNITALTEIFPDTDEVIVVTPAPERAQGLSIAGRLHVP
jgi:phosphohistidine phosphatase SixA